MKVFVSKESIVDPGSSAIEEFGLAKDETGAAGLYIALAAGNYFYPGAESHYVTMKQAFSAGRYYNDWIKNKYGGPRKEDITIVKQESVKAEKVWVLYKGNAAPRVFAEQIAGREDLNALKAQSSHWAFDWHLEQIEVEQTPKAWQGVATADGGVERNSLKALAQWESELPFMQIVNGKLVVTAASREELSAAIRRLYLGHALK